MATLTAAGINCSNGQLDGFYTGTTATNSSYPIGSYLGGVSNLDPCTYPIPSINNPPPGSGLRTDGSTIGYGTAYATAIAGTWRLRSNRNIGHFLFQRVA